jgi:hypothetical protein
MSGATRMGYEAMLYYGTAGSTAATLLENCEDLNYDNGIETGETTVRGDSTLAPVVTSRVTARTASITWKMMNKPADTSLTALIAAARSATAVALRYKSHSTGTGYDGDCIIEVKNGAPLKGQQTFEFTASPTDDEGRAPNLNA